MFVFHLHQEKLLYLLVIKDFHLALNHMYAVKDVYLLFCIELSLLSWNSNKLDVTLVV